MKYHDALISCEEWIRAGQLEKAVGTLKRLNTARIPRDLKLRFANLCRRVELLSTGLRILERVVHPTGRGVAVSASHAEVAEYAVLLQRSGALEEALIHLDRVDAKIVPEALLYRSFCHMGQFEYPTAAGVLRIYLQQQLDPYKNLVGRVNLANALIESGDLIGAMTEITAALETAKQNSHARLHANTLELRAHCRIRTGDLAAARTDLNEAAGLLTPHQTRDSLWIEKWQAVIAGLEGKSVAPVDKFRAQAAKRRHWQSVREADFFALQIQFDPGRFRKLYFGTPLPAFRKQLRHTFPQAEVADSYRWGSPSGPLLDLTSGEFSSGAEPLSRGNLRLISILMSDLYRPMSIGALFASLFPGDHFCIFSSPARVSQTIYRCRRFFEDNGIPLKISEAQGEFSLERKADFGIRIPEVFTAPSGERRHLGLLTERFQPGEFFTPQTAREVLSLAGGSFNRFTQWAVEEGYLIRLGAGPATRYKLAG